jgi:DNA-directed RNA polymerase specialized sigma24 family protein
VCVCLGDASMKLRASKTGAASDTGGAPARLGLHRVDEPLALLVRHREKHLRMLRSLLGNAADAEDVLQQSYVRALEMLGSVRDPARLGPWFERLARNAAVDRIRRRRAATRALVLLSRTVRETSHAPSGDGNSPCRCATRLLGVLPAGYAEVLRRVYLEEVSIERVASRLETTPNNVRVRLHRARTALRGLIEGCEGCTDRDFTACSCTGQPEGAARTG